MNHRTEFKEPKKLVQVLLKAWERMTKEEDVKSTLREVSSWNEIQDPSKCEECLMDLLTTKLNLSKSKKLQAWPILYLSEVPIQQYLTWVVEVMQGKNTKHIKVLMQRLVEPSDLNVVKNFPGKHLIFKWLNQTDLPADSKLPRSAYLKSLQHCVKKALDHLHEATAGDDIENMEQAQKQVTSYIAERINELHTCIQQQKYDWYFLSTLLYPLSFDSNEGFFGHFLSTDDLEYFSKVLEDQITEFEQLKCKHMKQKLQAYLFHLAVSFLHSRVDIEFQSMCCDHLHYLQMKIHDQLDQKIKDILRKHSISSSYDWAGLQQDLLEVMCSSADDAQTMVGSQLLNFLAGVQSATKHEIPQPCKPQYQRAKGNKEIQNVFEILGVSDFYPQKLTRKHALCIHQQTPESKQFYILEKIMMHNYQYWTCLIENCPFVIHPVDSLLALLLCADNFVRQDLLVKISTCKLAIPLLLPDPIAQTVTLPLWGMRPIVKEWKCKDTDTGMTTLMECSMVEHETPIVSFMRFSDSDRESGRSKSKILNEVIGNSQHNFFFHWDCDGGNAKRVLVDGVVELCWYLPAGKEADSFNKPVAFTNLRGDARKHRLQFEFLRQISLINFVLLTQKDLDDESIKVLEQLAQAPGVLVLMFPDAKDGDELTALESMSTTGYKTIRMKRKNLAVIRREIRSHITVNLQAQSEVDSGSPKFKSLKHCSEIAEQVGILIDEDDLECIAGLRLARKVLQKIQEVNDSDSVAGVKEKMLPLQSQAMWHTWAQHNKERHQHLNKGLMTTTAYNIEMDNKKDEIRRVQLLLCDPPTPVMKSFMSSLIQQKGYVRDYFLHWLKFFLDKRSRQILPPLQNQYDKLKCELQKTSPDETTGSELDAEKENVKEEHMKKTKKNREELANIYEKMIVASLGIEHLFRELGQIYESVMDIPVADQEQRKVLKNLHSKVSCLPVIAAELQVAGYPFELMDGDASHIPMTWMMAVLYELHTLLKRSGDAKLFAVSVLGIQSSGKSTLMNTMFGAKFAVSAGRCTRGAFIQLIPIHRDSEPCDYLLVVDTEGLRALELDSQKMLKCDNEMATFVIGLANVTIINIFGETPSDMQDILQTSVHAFLRMNKLELKPSCQFVHQNVTAIAADSKLMQGKANLVENLNEMVKYVAKEEQCESKYTTFDQVMNFDLENDVWYFPSLWKGDPPMAPVNPGYSDRAQDLKSALTIMATTSKYKFSITAFRKHIQDLWDAVLSESFVFSFKNMLEMTVYNELDCERGQWSLTLQSSIMKLQSELDNQVFSSDVTELDGLQAKLIAHLQEVVQKLQESLLKQAEEFFKNCGDHREIMLQWKYQTQQHLVYLCEKHQDQTDEYCRSLIRNRRARVSLDEFRSNICQKIQEPVQKLALRLQGRQLEKEGLESEFSSFWEELKKQVLTTKSQKIDINVEPSVEVCLKQLFRRSATDKLNKKLSNCSLRERGDSLKLLVIPDNHLIIPEGWRTWIKSTFRESFQTVADKQTEQFLEDAKKKVNELCCQVKEYRESLCFLVLRNVFEDVDSFNNHGNVEFSFTEEYKMDLSLTVAGYAIGQFEETVRENAPSTIFERLREPFFINFESQYSRWSLETAAAKTLSSHLKEPVHAAVIDSLVHEVACMVKLNDERFHTKHGLLLNILLDLESKRSFADYIIYLTDMEASLHTWIVKYTLEYCCASTESGQSRLEQLANAELSAKFDLVIGAASDVTRSLPENKTLRCWLTKFHKLLKGLFHLNLKEIHQILGLLKAGNAVDEKTNFEFFKTELINQLQAAKEEVRGTFKSLPGQMATWRITPYDILTTEMIGCCEQCPFCKAKCEYMNPDHPGKHRVSIHCPECLAGYRSKGTNEMVLDLCTSKVESEGFFSNIDTHNKQCPYKKYRTIYKNWEIKPNSSRYDSSFWKYFVAIYIDELAEFFGMKKPRPGSDSDKILGEWKKLEREKVLETLKASFNL